jgi:hypothetical protein
MSFMPHHYDLQLIRSFDHSARCAVERRNPSTKNHASRDDRLPRSSSEPFCACMHRTKIHQTEAAAESTSCLLAGHSMTERRES